MDTENVETKSHLGDHKTPISYKIWCYMAIGTKMDDLGIELN